VSGGVQVFWFGPILGGACGGALFDVIFSTKSSFARIRNCLTVFHRRDGEDEAAAGPPGETKGLDGDTAEHRGSVEGEEVGEHRKDGTAPTDELEVLDEKKDKPSSREQKPRRGTNLLQYSDDCESDMIM